MKMSAGALRLSTRLNENIGTHDQQIWEMAA
jgi:hypothetical protein